jgi:hypothetical protein
MTASTMSSVATPIVTPSSETSEMSDRKNPRRRERR